MLYHIFSKLGYKINGISGSFKSNGHKDNNSENYLLTEKGNYIDGKYFCKLACKKIISLYLRI